MPKLIGLSYEKKEERKLGIGGSDMPIILGLSKYKTPYQLYLEKKDIISSGEEMSPVQYWGNRLEAIIRDEFADRNNVLIQTPDTLTHPFYDFMRANIDGWIVEWNAVLEVKCSTQFMVNEWGEDGSDYIPMAYLAQVAHYCSVTNADSAYIAVLIGGHDYRQYKYVRDTELEKTIIQAASGFWEAVQKDLPPPPTNAIDLKLMFPRHIPEKSISVSNGIDSHLKNLLDTKAKMKELQAIEEESRFKIMQYMEDNECLLDESGRPLVTWKANKRGSRTFLLKGEK
jgi:putative phage-type endonuclease